MDARELRIGNLVLNGADTIIEVDPGAITVCIGFPDTFKPISLTEEWLTRFGFEWYHGDHVLDGVQIGEHEEWEGETTFKFRIDDVVAFDPIAIKYVHQLQNLYFSLTGKELKQSVGILPSK